MNRERQERMTGRRERERKADIERGKKKLSGKWENINLTAEKMKRYTDMGGVRGVKGNRRQGTGERKGRGEERKPAKVRENKRMRK